MYRLRKVARGDKERRFLGVCAGISKYINPDLDPVGIRLLWLVLACFAPVMVVLYFILAIVLKPEDYEIKEEPQKEPETQEESND